MLLQPSKANIIRIAKTFIGAGYHHQGRLRNKFDCVGLIILVMRELNLSNYDIDGYNIQGDGVDFLKEFQEQCTAIKTPEPGDILTIKDRGIYCHCGIMSTLKGKESIIHTSRLYGRCVEHYIDNELRSNIGECFSFPGIING